MINNKDRTNKLKIFPIFLVFVLVPLILNYHIYATHLEGYDWQSVDAVYDVDIFLYGKGVALCIVALLMVGIFLFAKQYKKGMMNETIPLLMYAILAVFSTLCSKYRYFSIHGIQDQFESIWVIFAYLVTAVYIMYVLDNQGSIRLAAYALLIGGTIMAFIGILQILKLDPLRTDFFKNLLLFGTGQNRLDFTMSEGRVYGTLFNPNYVGAYGCILIPCIVGVSIAAEKKWTKFLCMVVAGGLLICVFGAGAKNGVIALALCSLLYLVMYRKKLILNIRKFLIGGAIVVVLLIGMNLLSGNVIGNTLVNIFDNLRTSETISGQHMTDVVTGDDELELVLTDDTLHIGYQTNEDGTVIFEIQDNDGREISYSLEDTKARLSDERFSDICLEPCMIGDTYAFTVYVDDLMWTFSNQLEDGTFYFYDYAEKWVKLEKADSAVFTNCMRLFSGRGYIWAKTIPLLKHYIFVGSGPDTFQLVFPHHDYVDLAYKFAPNMLVTRAHNMYLQMAVQTGVISLICFLVFYGMYFCKCCQIYINRGHLMEKEPWLFHTGAGIFVGSFGYMLSGIVNDSLPVTAPLFWGIMGMGIAVNTMIEKKYGKTDKGVSEETLIEVETSTSAVSKTASVRKKKQSRKKRKQK